MPLSATSRAILGLCCAAPLPMAAQSVHWVRVTVGLEQSALHNPGESAWRYGGFGPAFALQYRRDTPASTLDLTLDWSLADLGSDVTRGSTALSTNTLGARYVRANPHALGATEWTFGADLTARIEATSHRYTGPFGAHDTFGFAMLGVGPVVRTRYRLSHATITNDLAIPVASWLDFPYSNGKANGERLRLTFASLGSLQSVDDALSYRVGRPGTASVTWTYRLSYLRYVFADARRVAHQSLSLTFDVPVRGGAK